MLGGALLLVIAYRRSSAALRHGILIGGLSIALLLPLMTVITPAWYIGPVGLEFTLGSRGPEDQGRSGLRPESMAATQSAGRSPPTGHATGAMTSPRRGLAAPARSSRPQAKEGGAGDGGFTLARVFLAVWLTGFLIVVARWVLARAVAARLVGAAMPVGAATQRLAETVRAQVGVELPVLVLESERLDVPGAWGFRPLTIVLPVASRSWSEAVLGTVLSHEMAHLARRDAWSETVAQAAVALHWFDPLAWLAYRRARREREYAADDAVLRLGVPALTYAEQLTFVAARLRKPPPITALALLRKPELALRVARVLDRRVHRDPLARITVNVLALSAVLLAAPIGAARSGPRPPSKPEPPLVQPTVYDLARQAADDYVRSVWSENAPPPPMGPIGTGDVSLPEGQRPRISGAAPASLPSDPIPAARQVADQKVSEVWGGDQ